MKPLVLSLFSALVAIAPLRAQTVAELKKKYAQGGQKAELAPAGVPAPIASAPEITIAEIEKLLLQDPSCKKGDATQLNAGLKDSFGLVSCLDPIDGVRAIVLVPQSVAPSRQLMYGSVVGFKLLTARLVDHYLVVEFDKQQQYLDLLKQGMDPATGKEYGFKLAGYVQDDRLAGFEDVVLFKDALKNYGGVGASSEMLAKLEGLIAKLAGGKPYRLTAGKAKGEWIVTVASDGNVALVWPEKSR